MADWISRRQVRLMDKTDQAQLQVPNWEGKYELEPKVVAARGAALIVAFLASLLLKSLPQLTGIMPEVSNWAIELVTDVLLAIITMVAVWWAGWKARHVQRPQAAGNAVLPVEGQGGTTPNIAPE